MGAEEVGRRLIDNVWTTNVQREGSGGGGGGSVSEVTSDDGTVTVTDGTGPTVDLSATNPGVDPPGSPTDGMLWWDPDDDTPASGSQSGFQSVVIEQADGGGVSGTFEASLDLAAGATLLDVVFYALTSPWEGDSSGLTAGDSLDAGAYIVSPQGLQESGGALSLPYTVGGSDGFLSSAQLNSGNYALLSGSVLWQTYYPAGATVFASVVNTVGETPITPTGRLLVCWWFLGNSGTPSLSFTPA